jgi:hypothetical protein
MTEIIHVAGVEVTGPHRLRLRFEDGAEGEVDFSEREWRGVFEPLADPDYFACVQLDEELGTIVWPGDVDMAPETLYLWATKRADYIPA